MYYHVNGVSIYYILQRKQKKHGTKRQIKKRKKRGREKKMIYECDRHTK